MKMSKMDINRRFIKKEEGLKVNFNITSFSRLILWGILLLLLSPWIIIIFRLEIWKTTVSKFEMLSLIKFNNINQSR